MKIKLGEKEIDLKLALPIVLGDVRKLKKVHGVNLKDLGSMDADTIAKIVLVLSQKIDPTVTEAEVDMLPMEQVGAVAIFLGEAGENDVPT